MKDHADKSWIKDHYLFKSRKELYIDAIKATAIALVISIAVITLLR